MKQNTKRFASMILALLLLVGALIVYFDLAAPAYSDLQAEKGQQISEENLLANEQQIVTQVQALVSAYQSQAQGQQSVNMALPIGQNVAGALTQVYGVAQNDGLSIQSVGVTNNPPQVQAAAVAATVGINGAASGGNIVKPLGSVLFQITAAGSYENFKNFIKHIETNTRVMDVKSIGVRPATISLIKGATSTQDFFNYTVAVAAYYQSP